MAGGIVFFIALAAAIWISVSIRDARRRRRLRDIDRVLDRMSRASAKEAEAWRASLDTKKVHDVLTGRKCRACGEMKTVRDVEDVPTADGKSATLCRACRALAGLDDGPADSRITGGRYE